MADTQEMTTTNGKLPHSIEQDAELQRTRERIAETAGEIERRVREDLDWRTWVRRYPLRAVGIAAAAGVLAGLALPGGRRRREDPVLREAGRASLLASVLSTVATVVVREGVRAVADRLLSEDKPQP